MYGPSGKLGRGGGAGGSAGKRRNIHAPPIKRPASTSRLSMGRSGLSTSSAAATPSTASLMQAEESFTLVRENPLNFGMAIKLAPNLVEEIKRVEGEGATARIKFDANANNPNGNVIQVGNKTFRFTWSKEPGDNCEIYEERQSGGGGNGLLVESGATWRKLNVERELDESTKNHVKRRSEEAERKLKSRRAIVLDHQTPSMQNQLKGLAAAEYNPWRNNVKQQKEPPFKKLKSEQPSAAGPPKSGNKSGLPAPKLSKIKLSSGLPLSCQLEQHSTPASQVGSGNLVKGHTCLPEAVPKKGNCTSSDKEMHSKLPSSTTREKFKRKQKTEAKPTDLKSFIISLLLEHQQYGMNLKALEKAVGDFMPNSVRQIEPILKQVATFQAPGKYFLKQGVELESYKKPPPQSGNSPEISRHESPAPQKFDQFPGQDSSFSMKTAARDGGQGELNSTPVHTVGNVEKIDIIDNSSEQLGDKKVAGNSEQVASSSSESDSSDSDSSDDSSDGESHSRRKNQSPEGSRHGSSSDSESDATSSSKQASDEDVDIMTSDDEKESKHKLQDIGPVSSKSPLTWNDLDNGYVNIGDHEKQDDHIPDVVDIEKDSPDDAQDAERSIANYAVHIEVEEPVERINPTSSVQQERRDHDREAYDGLDNVVNNGCKQGQSGIRERSSKCKSKRLIDDNHSDERTRNRKKLKSQLISGAMSSLFDETPSNSSPDRPLNTPDKVNLTRIASDLSDDPNSQTCFNKVVPDTSVSDTEQSCKKSIAASASTEAPSGERRSDKQENLDQGVKYSERSLQASDGLRTQKGLNAEGQSKDGLVNGKRPPSRPNTHISNSSRDNKTSTTERSQVMNDMGGVIQRAHSELELGEFQEPFIEEISGLKKQFERNSSFRHLESKPVGSEHWNSNISRVKTSNNITVDRGNLSSPNSDATTSGLPDGTSKKKTMEHNGDDRTKSYQKTTPPLNQHSHIEAGFQQNKGREIGNKSRFAEGRTDQGERLDSSTNPSNKVSITQQESDVGIHPTEENNKWIPNVVRVSNERQKDASLTGQNGASKRKESSLDGCSSPYAQYEKEEPELKGPIRDVSQYREYVKEYQEKYQSYSSLSQVLESYRDEFSKLGKDLEACKGRDLKRYNQILEQMRLSFRECGERHKRLKKVFIVLYEELKHLKEMIKDYAASYKKD